MPVRPLSAIVERILNRLYDRADEPTVKPLLVDLLPALLERGSRGVWTVFGPAEVYLRIGVLGYADPDGIYRMQRCVQIANVKMPIAAQRRGHFTAMVTYLRSSTTMPLYLENVLDIEWAVALMSRHGWRMAFDYGTMRSLVLD